MLKQGPLGGLRVVDCSTGTAGPRMTGFLADQGADVLWVEPPGGDSRRDRLAIEYSVFNRGKRSLELDVRTEAGHDHLLALLSDADVFLDSWRPGQADALGLGWAELHRRYPSLVHCSITGFGTGGRHRDLPGYEALVHAVAGSMGEQVGFRDGPIYEALPFASVGASCLGVIGTLASLYRRGIDGIGHHVETSLYDGALVYLGMMWGDSDGNPSAGDHMTMDGFFPHRAVRMITGFFRCADDEYIGVHSGAVGGFSRLMKVLGLDDRVRPLPPDVEVGEPLTAAEREVIAGEIHDIFASETRDVWVKRLLDADVCGIPCGRPTEIFDEPQPIANGLFVTVDDPVLGRIQQVGPPIRFSVTSPEVGWPAPRPSEGGADLAATPASHPWLGDAEPDNRPLLDGVKILDLGVYYAGPSASRHLADLGADVVKLETIAGDPLRGLPRLFRAAQAGKRAIAVDLKDPELAPARAALLRWADVVHHNMRPGAAERLGVGYDDARTVNPDVVYGYSPGWGSQGPLALHQSFEPIMSGYVGVGFEVAGQYNPPVYPSGNADAGNGLVGAAGILLGLLHRQRGGSGQQFENSQLNAAVSLLSHIVRDDDGEVLGAGRLDPLQLGLGPLDRLYETADGWVCIVAPRDRHLAGLGEVLGLDLAGIADPDELAAVLGDAIAARQTEPLLADLRAAGVPAAAPVGRNGHAFLNDPENARTGRVALVPDPDEGTIRTIGRLLRVSGAPVVPYRLAPDHGAHTDEILATCGYDADARARLRARGAIR